ncbi:MAG: hypothetical protein QXD62_03790 [Candidatus Woesearchaeota archaeon]
MEKSEVKDFLISVLVLLFIFSIDNLSLRVNILPYLIFYVVISYFPRILISKYFSKKIGYYSTFKLYPLSSFLSISLSFIGVKLALPGYNEILPFKFSKWKYSEFKPSVVEIGKISLLVSLYNIFLSTISLLLEISILKDINAWIAFSNLLPVLPFEGAKILRWNFGIWSTMFIFTTFLLIL